MGASSDILERLMALIEERRVHPPPRSYTSTLFTGGVEKIGEKVTEEAAELISAAVDLQSGSPGPEAERHLVHEAADLTFHMFVLLAHCGVTLDEVKQELTRRFGTSGLDEKASRPSSPS